MDDKTITTKYTVSLPQGGLRDEVLSTVAQFAGSSGLFILCHVIVVHGKSYRNMRMMSRMKKEEGFLTT